MRFAIVAVVFTAVGFLIGFFIEPELRNPIAQSESIKQIINRKQAPSIDSQTESVEFADIVHQATVFQQLLVAYQVAAASNSSELIMHLDKLISDEDPLYSFNIAGVFI